MLALARGCFAGMQSKQRGRMSIDIRTYTDDDLDAICGIWNSVIEEGNAFPYEKALSLRQAKSFFAEQTRTAVATLDGEVVGLYVLHPNNVGRCGHIANASYAVRAGIRGQSVGEYLVRDSIESARAHGFRIIQFNAVVATNARAIHLYNKIGFKRLGTIPAGFRMDDGSYSDITLFYISLTSEN